MATGRQEVDSRGGHHVDEAVFLVICNAANAGRIGWDYGTFFTKGQTMGTGQAPVKRYNRQLRDLIVTGAATPSFLVSHEVPLVDAVEAYDKFGRRVDGYTKVLLKPNG